MSSESPPPLECDEGFAIQGADNESNKHIGKRRINSLLLHLDLMLFSHPKLPHVCFPYPNDAVLSHVIPSFSHHLLVHLLSLRFQLILASGLRHFYNR